MALAHVWMTQQVGPIAAVPSNGAGVGTSRSSSGLELFVLTHRSHRETQLLLQSAGLSPLTCETWS